MFNAIVVLISRSASTTCENNIQTVPFFCREYHRPAGSFRAFLGLWDVMLHFLAAAVAAEGTKLSPSPPPALFVCICVTSSQFYLVSYIFNLIWYLFIFFFSPARSSSLICFSLLPSSCQYLISISFNILSLSLSLSRLQVVLVLLNVCMSFLFHVLSPASQATFSLHFL